MRHLLICATALCLPLAPLQAADVPNAAAVRAYAEAELARFPETAAGAAVLIARGDEVLYRGARGRASIELEVPLTPDHRFRIGSVTKQYTAAALLRQVDAGALSLSDPLSKFLPDYPGAADITVEQLLNHTAGVSNYTDIPGYFGADIRKDLTTDALIAVFRDRKVDFAPGEGWAYSNSGYVLAGAVLERVSGKTWDLAVAELLQPLGLTDTVYEGTQRIQPQLVQGYTPDGAVLARATPLSMTQPHAAGALIGSVDELHRWNRALHGGKVLSAASYAAMITPTGKAKDAGYGLGIVAQTLRGEPLLQHGGGINGFVSMLMYLPQSQLSVVVLRNSDGPAPVMPDLLARRLAAHALGKPYPEAKAVKLGKAELEAIAGVYRIDANSTRVLRVQGSRLISQRSGGAPSPVTHIGNDTFLYEGSLAAFVLERNADGSIKGMHFYAEGVGEGEGEFVPRTDENPAERKVITLEAAALQPLVGEYLGEQLSFSVAWNAARDGITIQVPGQPAFTLHAETPRRFFLKEVDASVLFAPDEGPIQRATLIQGAGVFHLERTEPTPAPEA